MYRRLLSSLLIAAAMAATAAALWWWSGERHTESTDDAYVDADIVAVSARLAGYVRTVDVLENQSVAAGVPLLTIDQTDYQLTVKRAQALLEARRATVARVDREMLLQRAVIEAGAAQVRIAQAGERRALLDADRFARLAAQRVVADQVHERAAAEADQAHAQRVAAEAAHHAETRRLEALTSSRREAMAALEESEAALHLAQLDLQHTVVRAPVSGIVGNRTVREGQYVRPGTQLLMLVPMDCSYVVANFKETQVGRVRPGQPVELTVDAYPGRQWRGRVDSLAPASGAEFALLPPENATGNFRKIVQRVPVRIALEPAGDGLELRPGLSVVVRIDTRDRHLRGASGNVLAQEHSRRSSCQEMPAVASNAAGAAP